MSELLMHIACKTFRLHDELWFINCFTYLKKMQTKANTIFVLMPDNTRLEVSYYCKKISAGSKQKETELIIQLHDFVLKGKIEDSIFEQPQQLEHLVHKKVINAKGHLCE